MSIELRNTGIAVLMTLLLCIPLAGGDLPEHAEFFSERFFDECDTAASVSGKLSFGPEFSFRNTVILESGPFRFHYRNSGTGEALQSFCSFAFRSRYLQAGAGRGQPHIARGIILGNTMMRMRPDPVSNFRMGKLRMKIRNYEYYKRFVYAGTRIRGNSLYFFQYGDSYAAAAEYRDTDDLRAGLAFYATAEPVTEAWCFSNTGKLRGSLDVSFTKKGFNHGAADVLLRSGSLRWHTAFVWLSPDFRDCKSDHKWGAGLKNGGRGFTAGTTFRRGRWKCTGVFCGIYGDTYRERRFMLNAVWKHEATDLHLAYLHACTEEIDSAPVFPFIRKWHSGKGDILKARIRYDLSPQAQLDLQIQNDIRYAEAFAFYVRLTQRQGENILRLQLALCRSAESVMYFLRPLSASRYGIRRAPAVFTRYIDIVYAVKLGPLRCSLLLRNEGLSAGMEMRL